MSGPVYIPPGSHSRVSSPTPYASDTTTLPPCRPVLRRPQASRPAVLVLASGAVASPLNRSVVDPREGLFRLR